MIENELKYILRWDDQFERFARKQYHWTEIEQAYLSDGARVRRKMWLDGANSHQVQFLFTYKQRLPTGRNVEIETSIDERDYNDLFAFAPHRLRKSRASVRRDDVLWDIDFPHWTGGRHFIVAEAEMPEEMEEPPYLLETIRPLLVYAVPRGDSRFTARRLLDETHAADLALSLGLGDQATDHFG